MSASDIDRWMQQLATGDVAVRREAARQLVLAGSDAARAAMVLAQAVGDADEEVATHSAEALENLGPPESPAAEQLAELLTAEHPNCGYWGATLLGRMGSAAAPAVSALTAALQFHASDAVRERAAWALGKIGSAAESSRAALEAATHSESPRLARLARQSLEQLTRSRHAPP
jgi:HEAT repeat protein